MDQKRYRSFYPCAGIGPLTCADIANLAYLRSRRSLDTQYGCAPENMDVRSRWEVIRQLQWQLVSDGVLSREEVEHTFNSLSVTDREAISYWTNSLATRLANIPELGEKEWSVLLQTVALGQQWYESVIEDPDLIQYLESEQQPIDLYKVLFGDEEDELG